MQRCPCTLWENSKMNFLVWSRGGRVYMVMVNKRSYQMMYNTFDGSWNALCTVAFFSFSIFESFALQISYRVPKGSVKLFHIFYKFYLKFYRIFPKLSKMSLKYSQRFLKFRQKFSQNFIRFLSEIRKFAFKTFTQEQA